MNDASLSSLPRLLRHTDWVNRLAHSLVADPEVARDVAQEAWRSALERPPSDHRNLRGWWAQVVRNSARRMSRSDERRRRREGELALPDEDCSTLSLVQRAELQRTVVGRVLALREPGRETVLLRFFEGLPPRRIAERQGVPVSTVHTRLQRALQQLRQDLGEESSESGAWALTLLPLAQAHASATRKTTLLSALSSSPGAVVLALAILVLGSIGAALAWRATRPSERVPVTDRWEVAPGSDVDIDRIAADAVARRSRESGTVARGDPDESSMDSASAGLGAPPRSLRGLLLDPGGRPLAGVSLRFGAEPVIRTDGEGAFSWRRGDEELVELVGHDRVLCGGGPPMVPLGSETLHLVAAPVRRIQGTVRDQASRPIEGASIEVLASVQGLVDSPYVLRSVSAYRAPPRARSDALGAFVIESLPQLPGTRLRFRASGKQTREITLDGVSELLVELQAEPIPETRVLRGLLVDPSGRAIAGATVAHVRRIAATDEEGRFELSCRVSEVERPLFLLAPGFCGRIVDTAPWRSLEDARARDPDRFVLGEEAATLRGVVLDQQGEPLIGVSVDLADPTLLDTSFRSVEARVAGRFEPSVTDAQGCFSLAGLSRRAYRFRVWRGSWCFVSEPVVAGLETVVLTRPPQVSIATLRGRLFDRDDRPLADVEIQAGYDTFVSGGGGRRTELTSSTRSDAAGRFELDDVSRTGWLAFRGPGLRRHLIDTSSLDPRAELRVRLARLQQFTVEGPDLDAVSAIGRDGRPQPLRALWPLESESSFRVEPRDGHWPVLEVSDDVVEILLETAPDHVERCPVPIEAGRVVRLSRRS